MLTTYSFGELLVDYAKWHYGRGVKELLGLVRNFLEFVVHLFSIPTLLKTLFHPWRRMNEAYKKGLDPEAIFESLVVNIIMRAVGLVSRLTIIIVGLVVLILVLFLSVLTIILWIFLPVILLVLLSIAVTFIFESL